MLQYVKENLKSILIILITSLGMFMTNLDVSIVNIALPTMAAVYEVSISEVSRVVLFYLLAIMSLLIVFGRLADTRGVERIFRGGFILFTLASLFCALSWSINSLSIFRFIQGIGGAMIEATSTALILKYLSADIRGRAFGINALLGGIGFAAGAPVGGLLVHYLNWKWIFLVNIPVGIIVLIIAYKSLQSPNQGTSKETAFDFPGAIISFFAMAALLYGLNSVNAQNLLSVRSLYLLLLACFLIALFLIREKKVSHPLLDLSLFNNRNLSMGLAVYMLVVLLLNGFSFLFPFYFESARGFTPDKAGLLLMIIPLMSIIISPAAGYFSDKKSPHTLCSLGMTGLISACIMFVFLNINSSILFIALAFILFGAAVALFFTADVTLVMSHAPEGKEGILSALIAVAAYTGAALGICLFSLVFSLQVDMSSYVDMTTLVIAAGFKQGAILGLITSTLGLIFALIAKEKPYMPELNIQPHNNSCD